MTDMEVPDTAWRRKVVERWMRRDVEPLMPLEFLERVRAEVGTWSPQDEEHYQARLRGEDPLLDMAVGALEARDWPTLFMLIAKPYRVEALCWVRSEMTDEQYWTHLGEVWTSVENLWQYKTSIRSLLADPRPGRERMMNETERAALAALPDIVPVFRGALLGRNEHGWSWTVDREQALWFARRFAASRVHAAHPRVLISGAAKRSEIVAYFAGRGESEVIVRSGAVKRKTRTPVELTTAPA
jgi:hypothetical protein